MDIDIFKWVLGTIAGGMILVFFIYFSFGHINLSTTVQERSLLERVSHEFEAFGISEAASKVMNMPQDIEFSCGNYGSLVKGDKYERELGKIVFASNNKMKKFRLWTKEWNWPMYAGNFYYVWDGKPIVMVYDEQSRQFLDSIEFPGWMQVEKIHAKNIEAFVDGRKYVFFSDVSGAFKEGSIKIEEDGDVEVWNSGVAEKGFWIGEEMMFGAIFSSEKEYICLQEKAVEQLKRVFGSYQDKARLMLRREQKAECSQILQGIALLNINGNKQELQQFYTEFEDANRALDSEGCEKVY